MPTFRLIDSDGTTVLIEVATNAGPIKVIASVYLDGDTLVLYNVHIEGAGPNILGSAELYRLLDGAMEQYDVQELWLYGFQRASGARRGRTPKPIHRIRRR